MACLTAAAAPAFAGDACVEPGTWSIPTEHGARPVAARELIERLRGAAVVLLGESHDSAEHHRWQLHTLAALHAQQPALVLGFEMFPRSSQPALERWVAGELGESEFLAESRWSEVWGFDAALYSPLFHFARMHRLPMRALNVERSLVRRIGREGWEAVPASEREGVGLPAPADAAYERELHEVYRRHGDKPKVPDDAGFRRFVAAQLTWDRAMAEAIQEALQRHPGRRVVAILGRGHAAPGAVPHQLRALGVAPTAVLLPWDIEPGCTPPQFGSAAAVFGLQREPGVR